jgi:transmembrane sensor
MEQSNENIDEALILAYLRGEAMSENLKAEIENWLINKSNQLEAKRLFQTWELSALASDHPVDIDRAFDKLKYRVGLEKKASNTFKMYWQLSAAACLLIFLSFIAWIIMERRGSIEVRLVTNKQKDEFVLEDSSQVSLNKNTILTYDNKAITNTTKSRKVHLVGEAYFEVSHNPDKPFTVLTEDAEILVLGTKFLVKAIHAKTTSVMVTEGKVKVTLTKTGKVYIVKANQEISTESSNNSIPKHSDINRLYWKTGILKFDNDTLLTVFNTLSREFNIQVKFMNKKISLCKLTATFKKQSLETIIRVIEETHQITIKNEGNILLISGNGCD